MSKVLFIAAHTDDELTSACTLLKLMAQGHEVTYLALSHLRKHHKDELLKESQLAMRTLGVTDLLYENFENRTFNEYRQQILETLIKWRDKINPQIVFCPSSFDQHQDHQVVNQEVRRAFKQHVVYGYSFPWNSTHTDLRCCSEITASQLDQKIEAMKHYHSQQHRQYFSPDYIRSLAIAYGVQFKVQLAEAFEVIKTTI